MIHPSDLLDKRHRKNRQKRRHDRLMKRGCNSSLRRARKALTEAEIESLSDNSMGE